MGEGTSGESKNVATATGDGEASEPEDMETEPPEIGGSINDGKSEPGSESKIALYLSYLNLFFYICLCKMEK